MASTYLKGNTVSECSDDMANLIICEISPGLSFKPIGLYGSAGKLQPLKLYCIGTITTYCSYSSPLGQYNWTITVYLFTANVLSWLEVRFLLALYSQFHCYRQCVGRYLFFLWIICCILNLFENCAFFHSFLIE